MTTIPDTMKITDVRARSILDSRGMPTVEADVISGSLTGRASVPSGASTGKREACELRDKDPLIYMGKSVFKAVENVTAELRPAICGLDVGDQEHVDRTMRELDGTETKERLGANAILAVSLATARLGALTCRKPLYRYLLEELNAPNLRGVPTLPTPLMNIINGGKHACNNLDIQEFMVVPHKEGAFCENLQASVEVFHHLKDILVSSGHLVNVGDEGGFAPNLQSHREAIESILQAVEKAGYKVGLDFSLALDSASSEFYQNGLYSMESSEYTAVEMMDYYTKLCADYPIYSIEDGLDEGDTEGWKKMTALLSSQVLLIGDDLFVTNKEILKKGIEQGLANAILIKPNQIGTLSETFEALKMAYGNNYKAVISHRSGETGDTFIADLAVATGAGLLKSGSASRSDRLEKYNRLLRIEEELGSKALFDSVKF